MASVTYQNVWKKFGDVVALQDLNLEIEDNSIALFGWA